MSDVSANNKRIAKNTFWLYLRMLISMAVSLYTSRVILQTLGVEDYGIYNIVGGVVAMFSFINATMSGATSRFLTYEIGKGDQRNLNSTFSASFWIHVIIGIIVIVLSETIGLWFLNNKMVIPEDRLLVAHIVFQMSVLSTFVSITQVPYNASLIAHEKMDVYAYVEIVNVFLKLLILYFLVLLDYDKLILYGFLVLVVSIGVAMYYRFYGYSHFEECKIRREWRPEIIKPMLSFSAWDFYGNMSVTARTQGVSMLLNVFFGPVMNAAAGIAASVQTAVVSFSTNISTAVRPQIIKSFAQGEYDAMSSLIYNASRCIFLVMVILVMPLCAEIEYILSLWLGEYPDSTPVFCILTLWFSVFANMSYVVVTGIHAYGKIIRPSLINGTLYLMVIPISYIVYKLGGEAWVAFLINLFAVMVGLMSNVYTLHLYVNKFSIWKFIKEVLAKCIFLVAVGICIVWIPVHFLEPGFVRLCITVFSSTVCLATLGWYIMLSKNFRSVIIQNVKKKLCKKK